MTTAHTYRFKPRPLLGLLPLGVAAMLAAPTVSAETATSLAEALSDGTVNLTFRFRSELVDDEAFGNDAAANTLRARLTYTSGQWQWQEGHSLDLMLEADYVAQVLGNRFNDTRNGRTTYPVVPDPKGADLNQAALRYRAGDYTVTLGRQRIVMDNQRFIGSVGWRQNEQTFDGVRVAGKLSDSVSVDYAWIDNTRRIFGPASGTPAARLDSNHHLLNVRWQSSEQLTAGAYIYSLRFADAAALSSSTYGVYATGGIPLDSLKLDYRAEYARQGDTGNNPASYSANYWLLSTGLTLDNGVRFGLAREVLGADSSANVAVQTPLATLHAFQGWTDKFLNTPGVGIENTYVSASGKLAGFNVMAVVHDYRADTGGGKLGREWNLQASRVFASNYTVTLKYADYSASNVGSDAQKIWLMAEARF